MSIREVIMRLAGRSLAPIGWTKVAAAAFSTTLLAGGWSALLVGGCSSNNNATSVNKGGGGQGGTGGTECMHNEPGCACRHDGTVIKCGTSMGTNVDAGTIACALGGQICSGGVWSACEVNANDPALQSAAGLKLETGIKIKTLQPAAACTNDYCDPYCMQYIDTAQGVDAGDGGIYVTDSGTDSALTIATIGSPDAQTPPSAVLQDAAVPDGESVIYIDLSPGQTATRTFTTPQATIKNADIYFLIDDTSSMGAAAANLASALTNATSGIIAGIKVALPNSTYFGVGRFEDFYQSPYVAYQSSALSSTDPYDLPYQNLLSVQSDVGANGVGGANCGGLGCTAAAVNWLTVDAFDTLVTANQLIARSGGDIPEGTVAALWSAATGNGLYAQGVPATNAAGPRQETASNVYGSQGWWQVPRQWWLGSPMGTPNSPPFNSYPGPSSEAAGGSYLPCPGGTVASYPCFRQGATPVFVVLSDAPGHDGPGGQYPHIDDVYNASSPHLTGANPWPLQPSGGCPTGYGGTVAGGGTMCNLTTDPAADTGLSFAKAIQLPTAANGLPLPGVYYGTVAGASTPRSSTGPWNSAEWYSASSVGVTAATPSGGLFTLSASTYTPGFEQRSSLRDCVTNDDSPQCTPGLNSPGAPSPTCYSNTAASSVVTTPAAGNSTYTPTTSSVPASTGPAPTTGAATSGLGSPSWTTTPAAPSSTSGSQTVGGTGYTKISVANGTTTLGTISLTAGQGITNLQVTVNEISQNYNPSVTASSSLGPETTGSVTASGNTSSAAGAYYAGAAGGTATITVTQNYSPNQTGAPLPATFIEVTVTYTIVTISACTNGGTLVYNSPSIATCNTCTGTGATVVAGPACDHPTLSCTGAYAGYTLVGSTCYQCSSNTFNSNALDCLSCTPPAVLNNAGTGTCVTTATCATGYTLVGGICTATSACINSASALGATGAGCPANSGNTTYTTNTTTAPSGGDPPGVCTCTKTVTTPAVTYTAANCPGGNTATVVSGTSCSKSGEGATCVTGAYTQAQCQTYNASYGNGYVSCQAPTAGATAQCTAPSGPNTGDGYFGNDIIYTFTVPVGAGVASRYYYHFALLREPGYNSLTGADTWVTGGPVGAAGNPPATVQPFIYLKAANGTSVNNIADTGSDIDPSYPYSIPKSASASDVAATNSGAFGPVVDCNKRAQLSIGLPTNTSTTDATVAEIDGYLPPGTYYLVIDNAAPTSYNSSLPAWQYFLQIGGFDDNPTNATTPPSYTQPSYNQMIAALTALQAKYVGVDNSGLSCFQQGDTITQAYAQYESRDFMEKIANDLGSYDFTTAPARPYVVPVRKDGTACNATCSVGAAACPAWCLANYGPSTGKHNAWVYDPAQNVCTQTCASNADCPMNAPNCTAGTPNYCSTGCTGGIAGLACAVSSAVANLTDNLKQNVYLRPISVNAGSTYVAPGATCTSGALPTSPATPVCTGIPPGGEVNACYGGTCTTTCNTGPGVCASGMCEPSTVPGDTNKYCISPAVFVKQVQADSTANSQSVCGLHPNQTACPANPCPAALPTCLPSGFCGVSDTGPDTITPSPSYFIPADPPQDNDGMFNFCSPGSQVNFTVTFQMPFQRGASVQEYQFDLGIYAGAGIIGRTRVIITNPALTVADYYRYYDGKQACAGTPGTHVVWGNLSYAAICPTDGAMPTPDYSQIRFCAMAAATPGGAFVHEPPPIVDTPPTSGCAADEVVLGIASDAPAYNSCPGAAPAGMGSITGFNITSQLPISEKEDAFLRIRMEFDPSTPGDAVAPFLDSWTLDIDCVPSE